MNTNKEQPLQMDYKKAVIEYLEKLSKFFDIITAINFLKKDWTIKITTQIDVPRYVFSLSKNDQSTVDLHKILDYSYLKIIKKKESATYSDLNEILLNTQMLARFYSFFMTIRKWSFKKIKQTFKSQSFDEYKKRQQAPSVEQLSIANL